MRYMASYGIGSHRAVRLYGVLTVLFLFATMTAPLEAQSPDTSLIVTVDASSGCLENSFLIEIHNTGERSDAVNVVVQIEITSGLQYVESLVPTSWNAGNIGPGTSVSTTATVTTNQAWADAAAGTLLRLRATVVSEDSRPDHTVGRWGDDDAINPGDCPDVAVDLMAFEVE